MGWGQFDCVIIHQALHELRHKDYAVNFHRQIKNLGGVLKSMLTLNPSMIDIKEN